MRSRHQSIRGSWVLAIVLLVGACGTGGERTDTTTPAPSTANTTVATTTTLTTTPTTTPTTAPTTTEESTTTSEPPPSAPQVDIETVVSWAQTWMDDQFARSDPPEGVTGAFELKCRDTGLIAIGGVFACAGVPRTEPDFQLDTTGVVVYVLDEPGTSVWEAGTDIPTTTGQLLEAYDRAPKGLFCRDLRSPQDGHPFDDGASRPDEAAFFWSLVYWSLEGEPARMDEDGNGIPCETLFDSNILVKVLEGGPVPLNLRD